MLNYQRVRSFTCKFKPNQAFLLLTLSPLQRSGGVPGSHFPGEALEPLSQFFSAAEMEILPVKTWETFRQKMEISPEKHV
jgi:hypothetical protein